MKNKLKKEPLSPRDAFYQILGAYLFTLDQEVDPELFYKTVEKIIHLTGLMEDHENS